jgi:hypothetical protein
VMVVSARCRLGWASGLGCVVGASGNVGGIAAQELYDRARWCWPSQCPVATPPTASDSGAARYAASTGRGGFRPEARRITNEELP